jgi:predicted helicase
MSRLLISEYLAEIDRLRAVSGSTTEAIISEAFKDLLKRWAKGQGLAFLAQSPVETGMKARVVPDGTILHEIRVPLGYWEAKDTADDLDAEIEKKRRKGYPTDNIVFEDSRTAVLIQDGREVARCAMTDVEALGRLLDRFFGWERPEIAEFRKAVAQFREDLPRVLDALREKIDDAYRGNEGFRTVADAFLDHARETINPTLAEADVREMLIQHILTEEIFTHVFDRQDFHRENNIAQELYRLEDAFFTGAVKQDTLRALRPFYAAIRANAAQITGHHEKQSFLKAIYETFYKVYNPKAADRLGVVYTPNEIVRFMVQGADWLCQTHFGKALIDPGVEILDPATGTGTFVCELIEHFRGEPAKLRHKYKEELHANEVAILPYYVANLNIEATFAAVTGQYAEFENLCFVDTLDNTAGLGIKAGHQFDMFGALSDENVKRVREQNKRRISVVIGNPPYNANQQNENDNNKNRAYPHIDGLIKRSFVKLSTAQKTKVYDMYARFFRWASDRLHDDGVIAFVTNRSFIDSRTFDGFRRYVAQEFAEVYVIDLGGDVRANPTLSGTKHNVFGIQTGVAISFLVKRRGRKDCRIHYARRPETDTAEDKLSWLDSTRASDIRFDRVEPDKRANWINQDENDWDDLIPVADKKTKAAKTRAQQRAVFLDYSMGFITARDGWLVGVCDKEVGERVALLIEEVNASRKENSAAEKPEIKWSRALLVAASQGSVLLFDWNAFRSVLYRPFTTKRAYFGSGLVEMPNKMPAFFPHGQSNVAIFFNDPGARSPFSPLASDKAAEFHLAASSDGFQGLPLYRYTPTGERLDNITDWAENRFRARYGAKAGVSKDTIFAYVYAALHDPVWRETYAINLKREFPRIPFHADFRQWADWGQHLLDLHIGYEAVEPWPLDRTDVPDAKARAAGLSPKPILKADRDAGVLILDSETRLSGVPPEAWDYRLGNRTALDWVLDQHKEKTPKDPTIRARFNTYRFADHKERVADLLARVTRVSVETVAIVAAMRAAR